MTSIISKKAVDDNQLQTTVNHFFQKYQINNILRQSNFSKTSGVSCLVILQYLFQLVFTGKNLWQTLQDSDKPPFAKDCAYRFLNSCHYNWRKVLFTLNAFIINTHLVPLTSEKRRNVFIIDDSLYSRNCSKNVELLACVKDHVENRYVKGFRMLTLGWSDGNTFLPLAFSLLSSEKEKNRLYPMNAEIDKRTNGYKLRKEAICKSTEVMIDLIKKTTSYCISASYVLFDSWFAFPATICKISKMGIHTICMVKKMPKVMYRYQGKALNLESVYATVKKKPGKAKILASLVVCIGHDDKDEEINAKIVIVRNRHKKRQWLALLSTDITLDDKEIVRIYGKRWNIEVFFKMTKSFLRLAKEFQCRSYDSMVAHTTIVCVRYIMLALQTRNSTDNRTFGGLFYQCCDEMKDIGFLQSLMLLIDLFKNAMQECTILTEDKIQEILSFFMDSLPMVFKEKLGILACES